MSQVKKKEFLRRMRHAANNYGPRQFKNYVEKASWMTPKQKDQATRCRRYYRTKQTEFGFIGELS